MSHLISWNYLVELVRCFYFFANVQEIVETSKLIKFFLEKTTR